MKLSDLAKDTVVISPFGLVFGLCRCMVSWQSAQCYTQLTVTNSPQSPSMIATELRCHRMSRVLNSDCSETKDQPKSEVNFRLDSANRWANPNFRRSDRWIQS